MALLATDRREVRQRSTRTPPKQARLADQQGDAASNAASSPSVALKPRLFPSWPGIDMDRPMIKTNRQGIDMNLPLITWKWPETGVSWRSLNWSVINVS